MSEPTYFVLAALLDERLHGYGIIKKAAALSSGSVNLTTGTLYGALDRLTGQGLVVPDGQEQVEGRTRRYYRITDAGAEAVHTEAERMRAAARVVSGSGRAAIEGRRAVSAPRALSLGAAGVPGGLSCDARSRIPGDAGRRRRRPRAALSPGGCGADLIGAC